MLCKRPHCHGTILVANDPIGGDYLRCSLCGRNPLSPPTRDELLAAGVYHTDKTKEAEGHRKRGVEFNLSPFHPPGRYARREQGSAWN